MRNAKTLAIVVALGLGLTFSSPFAARAKKGGGGAESMKGGLPALEDRVEADEALIATLETLVASAMHRLSAEFQNSGSGANEITTSVAPLPLGAGGIPVYSKTLSIPFNVVYVTFSAQGDSHSGAALSMSANITDATPTTTVCQPMAGQSGPGGGGTAGPQGWMTLLKLPTNSALDPTKGNCNDGSGGSADCHDNTIYFSCCLQITPDTGSTTHTVEIRLGSQPDPSTGTPGNVFYERSTIYIDASSDPVPGTLCSGVSTAPH